jgi:hypothetical protein
MGKREVSVNNERRGILGGNAQRKEMEIKDPGSTEYARHACNQQTKH